MQRLGSLLLKSSEVIQGLRFYSQGIRAIQDLDLLKILQSEINHELTSKPPAQGDESGSLLDFVLEWDSPKTQDVVLRKKSESGEEVAISALLRGQSFEPDGEFPPATDVKMKVCIKKPGLRSILLFDCEVSNRGEDKSGFNIQNAYYIQSASCLSPSVYRGPLFSDLDPQLQDELKKYLEARGIGESLLNFLLLRLGKKEQSQYVNWLQKLESAFRESD
ncbi:mitochondrial acidic protein mam33 [Coffea eugenioides]|uniref:mitochondrial acidic protein mam33 n=1 Tax=Coffea eugenioides TaxID=49369 RepID=UPI000F609AD2|nr:mitochondrial acidic protein mam33 [Coffea eugenioides]